ncbi:MAG: TetR-like C-terminal domain-containing protein [Pseudomonadota bacterium]
MATTAGSPEDRASAMCRAYVAFAKECPGHAAVMFQLGLLNQEDPAFIQQSSRAFAQLSATLAKAAPANAAKLSQATRTLWSAVHGLVALKMLTPKEADEIISFAVRAVVSELRRDST